MEAVRCAEFDGDKIDQLEDQPLQEGEWVEVHWPDKVVENYEVHIDVREVEGRRHKMHMDRLAYIIHPLHYTTNRLYLRWQPTVMMNRMIAPLRGKSPSEAPDSTVR